MITQFWIVEHIGSASVCDTSLRSLIDDLWLGHIEAPASDGRVWEASTDGPMRDVSEDVARELMVKAEREHHDIREKESLLAFVQGQGFMKYATAAE